MRTLLLSAIVAIAFAPQQAPQPINAMCPVKPRQKARSTITVVYEGQVIGLCCASCVSRFAADPKSWAAAIPEFKPVERKPGPCALEKVVKGFYCADDQKELSSDELKSGACPTCGKKPEKCEFCMKTAAGEKTAERSRVTYACSGCAATAEFEAGFKHEEDCKKKTLALKKLCSKSGAGAHITYPR